MTAVLAVLLGGVGALARAEVAARLGVRRGMAVVNLAGAFVLGSLIGLVGGFGVESAVLTVVGVGFVDALTTFSTWMLDTTERSPEQQPATIVVTLLIGVLLAGVGWFLGALVT